MLDPTRHQRLTASLMPILASGDHGAINNLFLRAIGDPRWVNTFPASAWLSRYGLHIEPLALDYHQEKTNQPLTHRGMQVFHPHRKHVSATIDAYRESDKTVIDCKAINAFRFHDLQDAVNYYSPQLLIQRECMGADNAALLVVLGGAEPVEMPAYFTEEYIQAIWQIADAFWRCVETLTPPYALDFKKIIPPEKLREVIINDDDADYFDAPNWAQDMRDLLKEYIKTKPQHKAHEQTKDAIKALLPDDVGRVIYLGQTLQQNGTIKGDATFCQIVRARNNAISIRQRDTK